MKTIYISAERSNLSTEQNQLRTLSLQAKLIELGFNFEVVLGCYREAIADKPSKEVTFRIKTDNQKEIERLAQGYNQDAILVQDGSLGTLVDFLNGTQTLIGKATWTREEPIGCYTYVNGRYLTFK